MIVVALIAATILAVWSIRRPFPDYDGTVDVPRLSAEVEIIRDEHGIPHIYADTAEDLFRAQGYVHAQDRFWEMDFRRHVTSGRLSELFGADQVETDAFIRTMGWRDVAREELPLLDPETRRYLQAYSDGVNAWLGERSGGELGLAYTLLGLNGADTTVERWSPVDSLSWLKAMAWDLRGNVEDEIDRALLAAEMPREQVEQLYPESDDAVASPIVADEYLTTREPEHLVDEDGEPFDIEHVDVALRSAAEALRAAPATLGEGSGIGSNSWVVDGSLTETGAPMLANDPHLGPAMPSIWYQVGLHCREVSPECPFEVAGYSFSGLPGVVIGHNNQIAWGFTNLGADVTDLYLEDVRDDEYRVGDRWFPMQVREERIRVAGGEDVTITVRSTQNGPLLSDHSEEMREAGSEAPADGAPEGGEGYGVALRWTALDTGRTADAIFALNAAQDWQSFRAAAELFEVPAQNLVYADVDGNIGYQAPGKIPVRGAGDGRYPVPGWTNDHQWRGYIPFDDLPSVFNPDEGMIVTANQPVASGEYPFLLTADFDHGHRAGRIRELLANATEGDARIDADTMVDIQMDTYSAAAEVLVPYLLDLPAPPDYYGDGLRMLRTWDYMQEPESGAAAYFNAVWRSVLDLTFRDELPDALGPSGGARWIEVMRDLLDSPDDPFWDTPETADVEGRDDILARAAEKARDEMTRLQGKDPEMWEWGRSHTLTLTNETFGTSGIGLVEDLFNLDPVAVGGGSATVQANAWNSIEGYEVVWVPSMRMVVDLDDLDASRWVDLTGVSGHPRHRHYGDQTELWRTGEMLPMRWSDDAIARAGEHRFTLVPRETLNVR
ncbi:penicillin acylase family protein [Phytoactinopolyspora halophila]|uniref:penicillin acylase family protein n=1 Tax=Phytoactinopolyspora halophila TaxID=1981511 RepID=UPI001B8CB9B1|nr:penicillin acylase family protein [Phytoactinopolyspora halophila]